MTSPLSEKRIVITRPRAQAAEFYQRLAALNAYPILFPMIEIAPPQDFTALDNALASLATYDWLVFTSVNGVAAFWKRLDAWGLTNPKGLPKIAAIGPATARTIAAHGVTPSLIPHTFRAHHLAHALGEVAGRRVLFPRSDLAHETLAADLRGRGALVEEVVAYRTLPTVPDPQGLAELRRGVDAITFTSPSAVNNFVRLISGGARYVDSARIRRLGLDGIPLPSLGRAAVACLGPTTAQATQAAGLPVDITAPVSTLVGLIAALGQHFTQLSPTLQENRWTRSLARCL